MIDSRDVAPVTFGNRTTVAVWNAIRVRPRAVLVALALTVVTAGIAMNWTAVVAAGIAPLLISALPCAVMCALGLCMHRMGGRSCASESIQQPHAKAAVDGAHAGPISIGRSADQSAQLVMPFDSQPIGDDELTQQRERRPAHA